MTNFDRIAAVIGDTFLLRSRTTRLGALRMQRDWIVQLSAKAKAAGKTPLLSISFDAEGKTDDWLFMPRPTLEERVGRLESWSVKHATAGSVRFGRWDAEKARQKTELAVVLLIFGADGLFGIPMEKWSR